MTKRQENALKTRQKLLDVAHNLIKTKGFYKLSVEDITKEAGVAKGTFYIYFKHKEEIVMEICKGLFQLTRQKLDAINDSNIKDRLYCYYECFIKEVQGYQIHIVREWIKGIVENDKNNESMGLIKWNYDLEMLQNILFDAVARKELKSDTPIEILSKLILTQMYGMLTCWCMSDGAFNPEIMIKDFYAIQVNEILNKYLISRREICNM